MGDPTRGGRWIVQQQMPSTGAWIACMIGAGYESIEDAQADADHCNSNPHTTTRMRVADRWTGEPVEEDVRG